MQLQQIVLPNLPRHQLQVKWNKPMSGRVKINIDGLVMGSSKKACRGCVLRNSASDWILGFFRNLGTTSSIKVELWALKMTLLYLCSWNLITLMQKWMLKFLFTCLRVHQLLTLCWNPSYLTVGTF